MIAAFCLLPSDLAHCLDALGAQDFLDGAAELGVVNCHLLQIRPEGAVGGPLGVADGAAEGRRLTAIRAFHSNNPFLLYESSRRRKDGRHLTI